MTYEFDAALSFAGTERAFARAISAIVIENGVTVFLDDLFAAEMWGKRLVDTLEDLYENQAEFCIIICSKEYNKRLYTNIERRAALQRAIRSREEYILPLITDEAWIEGLPRDTAYIDMREKSLIFICETLIRKIKGSPEIYKIKLPDDFHLKTIINELIDQCLLLSNQDQTQHNEMTEKHVETVMEQFDKVHVSYLETFYKYRDIVKSSESPFNLEHPVFDSIEKDIRLTYPMRKKLGYIRDQKISPQIQTFIYRIDDYMYNRIQRDLDYETNAIRRRAANVLRWICGEDYMDDAAKRLTALHYIKLAIEDIESQYISVFEEYQKLLKDLTTNDSV